MNRILLVIVAVSLVFLSSCTKKDKIPKAQHRGESDLVNPQQGVRPSHLNEKMVAGVAMDSPRLVLSEEEMLATIITVKTIRVSQSVVDGLVDRILTLDDAAERLSQMRSLSRVVAARPDSNKTPLGRSMTHELRFKMGLEVFDGFLKLGKTDDAWQELLALLEHYQRAIDEARQELKRCELNMKERPSNQLHVELQAAREYQRYVNSDFEAAKEFTREFVLPNVLKHYSMSETFRKKMVELSSPGDKRSR